MTAPRQQARAGGGKGGRPSKFRPEFVEIAGGMARLGATDIDIAKALGVSVWTLWRWQSENEELCKALVVPPGAPDDRAERSLYQRAVGYSYESEKIFCSKAGQIIRAPIIEHCPPDPGAAMKFLANRRPDRWKERHTHELTGAGGKDLVPEADSRSVSRALLAVFGDSATAMSLLRTLMRADDPRIMRAIEELTGANKAEALRAIEETIAASEAVDAGEVDAVAPDDASEPDEPAPTADQGEDQGAPQHAPEGKRRIPRFNAETFQIED